MESLASDLIWLTLLPIKKMEIGLARHEHNVEQTEAVEGFFLKYFQTAPSF